MDGGTKQEEMAERLKQEVKERARYRYGDPPAHNPGDRSVFTNGTHDNPQLQSPSKDLATSICDVLKTNSEIPNDEMKLSHVGNTDPHSCANTGNGAGNLKAFQRSDSMLVMFYLEHVLPFLFPFYNPSLLQGGKSWILDLMITSPVYRQASLCQSSFFFSLARGLPIGNVIWETVLKQTGDAFEVLRQALLVIDGPKITEHMHGAVRILASIMQLQHFETTILSFDNCQAHLNAALALFGQLLDSSDADGPTARFQEVMNRLGPSPWNLSPQCMKVPSAEQAAFRFSSTQLILDDIIASTVLQEQPKLYEHHQYLLSHFDGTEPSINFEAIIGCQNWALQAIGNIAALDSWKQQRKTSGNLDIMELVSRATVIKESLQSHLMELEMEQGIPSGQSNNFLDTFTADYGHQPRLPLCQLSLVTRVWAHAALVYLFVVVSGWQPANADVRYNVGQIVELLTNQLSLPTLIRTMAWPFCVAGCLAEPVHEASFRQMVEPLQPTSVFGTVRKALEIMENVWKTRDKNINAGLDLATCFRSQGQLILLV
jgi:hypothetical protein